MAERTINARFIIRNDTASNWKSANPVLLKGEMGIETDTRKFKFGDGTTQYNSLPYVGYQAVTGAVAPTASDSGYEVGTVYVDTATDYVYFLVDNTSEAAVWHRVLTADEMTSIAVGSADKLTTPRAIALSGDVTGSANFDGSADATITATLKNSGVTAGQYTKVTVDAKGIVTAGAALDAADIPNLTLSKITDAGTAAAKNTGTADGNIPVLGANGKLDSSVLPAIAITETFVVNSEAAMTELTAQEGDVAVRTDVSKSFILTTDDPSVAANWQELLSPTDAVKSVNGKTGAVTLTTDDIAEGSTNQYYTEGRATANFESNIATTNVAELADGANVLMATDTFTFNGGNASTGASSD